MTEYVGEDFAELFGDAHEITDNPLANTENSHNMDYWNNQAGRDLMTSLKSGVNYPTTQDVINGVNSLLTNGQLLIIGADTRLVPSNSL